MGREFYRSDDFIIYHCDGCGNDEVANTDGADEAEGADIMQKRGWSIWRPLLPGQALDWIGKRLEVREPLSNEYGYVERHYCPACTGPTTDYSY
jgi:hypothetical protein